MSAFRVSWVCACGERREEWEERPRETERHWSRTTESAEKFLAEELEALEVGEGD